MKTGLQFSVVALMVLIVFILAFPNSIWGDEEKSNDKKELHEKGQQIFQSKGCIACHTIGKGRLIGPDLKGVTERREEEWLRKWLKDPNTMIYTDPIAKELLKEYPVPMPNQGLTDEDIEALIIYFKYEDSNENKDDKKEKEEKTNKVR